MSPEVSININNHLFIFKTYTLFIFISTTIGASMAYYFLKRKITYALPFLIGLIISFFIGARLLNFIVNHEAYAMQRISLFQLKATGFSFYGGVSLSIVYLLVIGRIFHLNLWFITDALVLPFGISFFIMRIGCFFNGCCFGKTTTCFLGVTLPNESFPSMLSLFSTTLKIHPSQLYEGFGVIFAVLFLFFYKRKIQVKGLLTLYFGIYLTALRLVVLYFRVLEYPKWVTYYFYPFFYLSFIFLGYLEIQKLKKENIY